MFFDELRVLGPDSYEISILPENSQKITTPIKLEFTFPARYPSHEMPVYTIIHPMVRSTKLEKVADELNKLYAPGEVVIFKWIDWLRDNFCDYVIFDKPVEKKKQMLG